MSFSTLLISLLVVAAILLIIRLFWPILVVIFYLLNLLWWSFVAAVIWAAFVAQTSEGWVTAPDLGLKRNDQLKACGNGVVPQQAELALRMLLDGVDLWG